MNERDLKNIKRALERLHYASLQIANALPLAGEQHQIFEPLLEAIKEIDKILPDEKR